ncbi:MAG: ArsR/SmtB family transcription factor [Gemmatimonadota bacterium]
MTVTSKRSRPRRPAVAKRAQARSARVRPVRRTTTPALLARVALRFRALAEPARLTILHALEDGPLHVGALVARTGLTQANLSKHLQVLHAEGFVTRARDGMFVRYALADAQVLQLCAIMCDRIFEPAQEH